MLVQCAADSILMRKPPFMCTEPRGCANAAIVMRMTLDRIDTESETAFGAVDVEESDQARR